MGYAIKQKIDICLMAESHPEMTQQDLALWAQKRYGSLKPPSQTTISRILSKKDEFISLKEHEFKLIRRRRLSNPLLRKVLLEWISQCVWNNIPITAPIIMSSAGNFWKQLPTDLREGTGEFSYRWCQQFLLRVSINLNNIERELYNRLKIWTFEERSQIKDLLAGVDPKKIFTLSEVCISYDLPLDKSLFNDTSDFVTCMLCVNSDGSEKLDPFIIGRYENYPSFEGKSSIKAATKHGVTYHSNRRRWLTLTLFYDWLAMLDKRLALVNRDIIIVLDDSAPHRVVNIKLRRIRLLYISSSSKFSPMSWGIEKDFKLNFRISQYRQLIEQQHLQSEGGLIKEKQVPTMAQTFDLIKEAWNNVPKVLIQSSWKRAGFLPDLVTESYKRLNIFESSAEIELEALINAVHVGEKWNVPSLLDLTIEQKPGRLFLSISDTIESCIVDDYLDFNHDGKPERAPFSHTLGQSLPKLHKLGERLNSDLLADHSATENSEFGQPDLDLPYFDIDEKMTDVGSMASINNINDSFNFARGLQPMSELVPFTYEDDLENWSHWSVMNQKTETPDLSTPDRSSIPGNWDFPDTDFFDNIQNINTQNKIETHNNDGPLNLVSNDQYKLVIIDNFLKLIEQDQSLSLSDISTNEIFLMRNQVLQSLASNHL